MASTKAQLNSLKNVPLFSACSKRDLERVAKATAGSIVIDQGDMGREAFIILKGEVTIKRNNRQIATLSDGDVVGELSLLDHGPRTASVTCATDCTLLVIDHRRFINVLDEVPSIAHKLMGSLAARIRIMDRTYTG
jgi:CRP-like cAMP-binding protein